METTNKIIQKKIPGPAFKELLAYGILLQENHFPFESLQVLQKKYGDIIYCPWPNRKTVLICSPEGMRQVLKDKHNSFHKGRNYKHLRPLIGDGLLTSEEEVWREQRATLGKEFQKDSLIQYFDTIKNTTKQFISKMELKGPSDLSALFSDLTFQIIGKIFFHQSFGEDAQHVSEALRFETERIQKATKTPLRMPNCIPTKENLLGQKHRNVLRNITLKILNSEEQKSSLMGRMLDSHKQGSIAFSEERMIDQMMTLMLAGHETTSNTLMWTSYLLNRSPSYLEQIRQEFVENVSSLEQFKFEDLPKLKLLRASLYEAMRLYPPIPMIGRSPKGIVNILGYDLPQILDVVNAIYLLHHDEKNWKDPESFKPERFINFDHRKDTEFKFIPFGHGPRRCIGDELAMMEGLVIFTLFSQLMNWKLVEGFKPIPVSHITLQSQNGMLCDVEKVDSVKKLKRFGEELAL